MDLELEDKVAVVTGASRGLGLASARALAAEGCHVVICARGEQRLAEAAQELRTASQHGATIVAVAANVAMPEGVARVIGRAVEAFGGFDILVNNVGLARLFRTFAGAARESSSSSLPFTAGKRVAG
ncbi:MAG: SDR family NAD(P)-dependent oxidoreductase [Acidobacteria bacterium]|nr:SDR family NAD(P)-dependent oxidoreductase [Acidobacteriota bacterium]